MIRPSGRGLVAAFVLSLAACTAPAHDDGLDTVVVSVFPIADLVQRVAGDALHVETLLPPRASPDTWEATPQQVRALSRAAGYVTVGGGLDGWLDGFAQSTPALVLTAGMELRDAGHDHGADDDDHGADAHTGDPHIWLDPIMVREDVLPRIVSFLAGIAPDEAAGFAARGSAVADTLDRLHQEIHGTLRDVPVRSFVATHDAWAYFAARYGLEPLGSIYERPGHEPSVRGLAALIRAAREAGVNVILAEPQLAESGARALATELGASVRIVDPLGGPGLMGRESYTDMMRTNAREFARAMGAR